MATTEQINEWKEKYGKIYKIVPIEGLEVIYKPLNRSEYIEIMGGQMTGLIDDPELETIKKCVINDIPEDIYAERGGLITVIYDEVMKKSGFVIVESEEL